MTGGNLFFAAPGAVLEVLGAHRDGADRDATDPNGVDCDGALISAWRARVERAAHRLGWGLPRTVARFHRSGMTLAMTAPPDQLLLATEVNEWALCASLFEREPVRWSGLESSLLAAALEPSDGVLPPSFIAPVLEESTAMTRFERLAARDAKPRLLALIQAADARGMSHAFDDDDLTLGSGAGGRTFPMTVLPDVDTVPWDQLRDIPTALVTGSNGKTTTVRLLAACARSQGWPTAYNCTDGVFFDDEILASGDYSGPAGARTVLREHRAQAAILETARGGILRRGLAISQAAAAVITNVSADHFGEYGIDDIEGLAAVKFAVAGALRPDGMLVLNADDKQLRASALQLKRRFGRRFALGWFSNSDPQPLREFHAHGASTCGPAQDRLLLRHHGIDHDLGSIARMPLSMNGIAAYNIANLAAAALGAAALGISPATIANVLARFGAALEDNPGRLMRFQRDGVNVIVDYAHNPDGLRGLLEVAASMRGSGRLGLLLGQAGNRSDVDLQELSAVAAHVRPTLVVIKENETQLRGRAPGETPKILFAALQRLGIPELALAIANSEVEAARYALGWARPGDVLAFPIHSSTARTAVLAMLQSR